jgi:hypothetical protein
MVARWAFKPRRVLRPLGRIHNGEQTGSNGAPI